LGNLLHDKSETQGVLKKFLRRAQNEFNLRIKKIRSNNGSEFKNTQVDDYLDEEGIKHEFSAPYAPQLNGVAERKNRTLIEMARTMLDEYKTSDRFWAEAVNTACHAINRLYLHRLLKKTPYELLTGNKPNVSYFRVFRSKCYILNKKAKSSKFAPKAMEGFLLGYDLNSREYRVFNKISGCVEISCDVVFDETNGSQGEQVDLDELDDKEAPSAALRNMSIGDVRPQESSNDQGQQSSNKASPPTQDSDHQKMAMIKGEVLNKMKKKRMTNKRSQEIKCHILGCTKVFNGITPWTTLLVTLQREQLFVLVLLLFVNITPLFLLLNLLRWKMLYKMRIG
jgi:hypothetical protein